MADEVVVAVKRAEPVPWLEVHGHGGREVVRFLIELFREQGLQFCSWEDFLRKTSDDALSAAAAIALAQAATLRTAGVLLDQQQGRSAWLSMRSSKRWSAARRGGTERLDPAGSLLGCGPTPDSAVARGGRGCAECREKQPGQRPGRLSAQHRGGDAGHHARCRHHAPRAGRLVDRAGGHGRPATEAEALEEQGIHRARATAANADLCLWLLDGSAPPVWPDETLAAVQYVINKSDLPPAWEHASAAEAVRVSAQTGEGLAELCAAVVARLVPDPPPSRAAVPFTPRLCEGIVDAQRALGSGNTAAAHRIVVGLRLHDNNSPPPMQHDSLPHGPERL